MKSREESGDQSIPFVIESVAILTKRDHHLLKYLLLLTVGPEWVQGHRYLLLPFPKAFSRGQLKTAAMK
jgi:hypothetical protein